MTDKSVKGYKTKGHKTFKCIECGHQYDITGELIEKERYQFIGIGITDVEPFFKHLEMSPEEIEKKERRR